MMCRAAAQASLRSLRKLGCDARRPYDHHHPSPHMTGRDITWLAVVEAVVCEDRVKALEHLRRIGEIEPALPQCPLALGLVEGDLHGINVHPFNQGSQHLWGYRNGKIWPFDALAALRERAKAATERLAADCPQDMPAAPSARLEAVEQGIDATLAVFDQVQPALQSFYGALDDEQKARLYRDMMAAPAATARETTPRHEAQDARRESREYGSRRHRWRAYAAAREAPARETAPRQAAPAWSAMCDEFAAVLRNWPVREIERDVRLSSTQRGPRDAGVAGCPSRRVLRARHLVAESCRHARGRLPRRDRAHPGRPHGRDAPAPCRRARRHRRDPPRARALLRGARPGAEGEIRGDELGGSVSPNSLKIRFSALG